MPDPQPADAVPGDALEVLEVEETPELTALLENVDVEVPDKGEATPAAPAVPGAPVVPAAPAVAAAPVAVATDPEALASQRAIRRAAQRVDADLDAVALARAGRPAAPAAPPPVAASVIEVRPVDIPDAQWDEIITKAEAAAEGGSSYGEAMKAGLTEFRKGFSAATKKASETAQEDSRRQQATSAKAAAAARINAQADAMRGQYADFDDVLTKSGILTDILPLDERGQVDEAKGKVANPVLNRAVYTQENPAMEMYLQALGRVARAAGRTLEQELAQRGILTDGAPATVTPPAKPVAAAPAPAPGVTKVIEAVTKPVARGLKSFAPAGAPTRKLTSATLYQAMTKNPDAYLKWVDASPDNAALDRAFMAGELDQAGV